MPRFSPEQIRRRRLVAAVVALGVLVGAVLLIALVFMGGVSKDDFIAEADGICRSHQVEGDALGTTDLAGTADLLARAAAALDEQTKEIAALDAPEEDAQVLEEWLESQEDLEVTLRSAAEGAEGGSQEEFDEAMAGVNEVAARSTNLALEYGFEVCGLTSE